MILERVWVRVFIDGVSVLKNSAPVFAQMVGACEYEAKYKSRSPSASLRAGFRLH
jgi:hypothetical protein